MDLVIQRDGNVRTGMTRIGVTVDRSAENKRPVFGFEGLHYCCERALQLCHHANIEIAEIFRELQMSLLDMSFYVDGQA